MRAGLIFDEAANLKPVTLICGTACVSLGMLSFLGNQAVYFYFFPRQRGAADWILHAKARWVVWSFVGFLIVPAAMLALFSPQRLRHSNLSCLLIPWGTRYDENTDTQRTAAC